MSLDADQVRRYLARIRFDGPVRLDLATLERLQRAHLTAVPFENLHVFHRRGVMTTTEWSVQKIVTEGRGGWCFELNGAFSALLDGLGFEVTRLSAGVMLDGDPPDEPDHLTLKVDLQGEPYLVDVGFGDSFLRPLQLGRADPQDGGQDRYRFRGSGEFTVLEVESGDGWTACFRFRDEPRTLDDFAARSDYLQNKSGLRWTEAPFATRLLDGGPDRVWLLHDRLKIRRDRQIIVTPISAKDWPGTLEQWFNMTP